MIAFVYYVFFQYLLQNALLQELPEQSPVANKQLHSLYKNSYSNEMIANSRNSFGNTEQSNEDPYGNVDKDKEEKFDSDQNEEISGERRKMKSSGNYQLKVLLRLLKVKGGFKEGVKGATEIFKGINNVGDGMFGLLTDGTKEVAHLIVPPIG